MFLLLFEDNYWLFKPVTFSKPIKSLVYKMLLQTNLWCRKKFTEKKSVKMENEEIFQLLSDEDLRRLSDKYDNE